LCVQFSRLYHLTFSTNIFVYDVFEKRGLLSCSRERCEGEIAVLRQKLLQCCSSVWLNDMEDISKWLLTKSGFLPLIQCIWL
jgi:hypothetical protein